MASLIEKFDDDDREAAYYLLENFWILRDRQPEVYQLIHEREQKLRNYFSDKCGFQLIFNRQFAKLEKIPDKPESWMGVAGFQQCRDYALLCCLLAFLEEKSVDEQFLLSDLCETLLAVYPPDKETGELVINWESYEWRKSLVRVLTMAVDYGIVLRVDGDIAGFTSSAESEALFEVPITARYFLRSYPKDLHQYDSLDAIITAGVPEEDELTGRSRKQRVYKQLLLTPGFERHEAKEEDFLYLRNMRNRLREDIEDHTWFRFELYKDEALLTVPAEKRFQMTTFPDRTGMSSVMLHFAATVRDTMQSAEKKPGEKGLALTPIEFDRLLDVCRRSVGSGWTKEYRDISSNKMANELLNQLTGWKMARRDVELDLIVLSPLLGRTIGVYPDDYRQTKAGEKKANERK